MTSPWSVTGRVQEQCRLASSIRIRGSGSWTAMATISGTVVQWTNASAPSGVLKILPWSGIGTGAGSRLLGSFVQAPASGFSTLKQTGNGTAVQWTNASVPSGVLKILPWSGIGTG